VKAPIDLVRDLLAGGIRIGEPRAAKALTFFPLFTDAPREPRYVVAAEAFETGTLTIGELEGGVVPQLVVQNRGELPVLLVDGEHLEGARQNRVLNTTVLAAPMHDTVIPVSCVEQGRWHFTGRQDFVPAPELAYAELREMKASFVAANARAGRGFTADQAKIWAEVERKRRQVSAGPSSTGAMRDTFAQRRAELDRIVASFPAPEPGQTGVIACVGRHPVALDAFEHPSVLARLWPRLVNGYAMDALGRRAGHPDPFAVPGFLAVASRGEATSHEGVGLGIDVILTAPALVALALTWERGVVHTAAFAAPRVEKKKDTGSGDRTHSRRSRSWFADPPATP